MIFDFASITLIDEKGRTVCQFVKEKPDSGWTVADKPGSRKHIERLTELARQGAELPPTRKGHLAPSHLLRRPDGGYNLSVPGLTRRWEKVTPALDRLAQHDIRRVTIRQLRTSLDLS